MTYVVVINRQEVIGTPFNSYEAAFQAATRRFGDSVVDWIAKNLRIEENR